MPRGYEHLLREYHPATLEGDVFTETRPELLPAQGTTLETALYHAGCVMDDNTEPVIPLQFS